MKSQWDTFIRSARQAESTWASWGASPEDQTFTRYDQRYFNARWPFPEHKLLIDFITNTNLVCVISRSCNRRLVYSNGSIAYPINAEVIDYLKRDYPGFVDYFDTNQFLQDFWNILRDLTFSNLMNNNQRQKYFIVDNLNDIRSRLIFDDSVDLNFPILCIVSEDFFLSYTKNPLSISLNDLDEIEKGTIHLTQDEIRLFTEIGSRSDYSNLYKLLDNLPISLIQKLYCLIKHDEIPAFLKNFPFSLYLGEENGTKVICMRNCGKGFDTITTMNFSQFLRKLKKKINNKCKES